MIYVLAFFHRRLACCSAAQILRPSPTLSFSSCSLVLGLLFLSPWLWAITPTHAIIAIRMRREDRRHRELVDAVQKHGAPPAGGHNAAAISRARIIRARRQYRHCNVHKLKLQNMRSRHCATTFNQHQMRVDCPRKCQRGKHAGHRVVATRRPAEWNAVALLRRRAGHLQRGTADDKACRSRGDRDHQREVRAGAAAHVDTCETFGGTR